MLDQMKQTYDGDIALCLQAGIDSDITSPTTRARLEWALEEIARLNRDVRLQEVEAQRLSKAATDSYSDGYRDGFEDGVGYYD